MLRLQRAEKQHWPGPGITRREVGLRAFLPTQAHPPLCSHKGSARDTIPRSREAVKPPGE